MPCRDGLDLCYKNKVMHTVSSPAILYFGTPVVLISTVNEDGSYNVAPMSSVFWLGWRCMIGLSAFSKTTENILRTGECVLNLPSEDQVQYVDRLALTTGSDPVPAGKLAKGYRTVRDKFRLAGLTAEGSSTVMAPRVKECPVQLEAKFIALHRVAEEDAAQRGRIVSIELQIQQVHVWPSLLMDGHANRIDPDKWRPLIMSFQQFYGLGEKLQHSTLGTIPERLYQTPDLERAARILEEA